jgi:multidrug efflux pump subunit AcrA (membrane-fusion protein)
MGRPRSGDAAGALAPPGRYIPGMHRPAAVVLLATACVTAQEPELIPVGAEVRAAQTLVVRSPVAGIVARVLVAVGDRPQALQQLVAISTPDLRAEQDRAEAELFAEEKVLEILAAEERVMRIRLDIARRRLQAAESRLQEPRARLQAAEQRLAEVQAQREAGRAGADEVARAATEVADRRAQVDPFLQEPRDEVAIAEHEQVRAVARVVAQRGRIDVARAAREAARIRAESGEVKCLLPGARISRIFVAKGELLASGDALLELVDDTRVRLVLDIPAWLAPRVRAGTAVRLARKDGAPADLDATIVRVSRVLDPDTQVMAAELEFDNKDGQWLPGLRLVVRVVNEGSR